MQYSLNLLAFTLLHYFSSHHILLHTPYIQRCQWQNYAPQIPTFENTLGTLQERTSGFDGNSKEVKNKGKER